MITEKNMLGPAVTPDITDKPVEVNATTQSLDEYVAALPRGHRARMELTMLRGLQDAAASLSNVKRSERLTVASRLLAAVLCDLRRLRRDDPLQDQERLVADAVWYADQLLARVDETETNEEGYCIAWDADGNERKIRSWVEFTEVFGNINITPKPEGG